MKADKAIFSKRGSLYKSDGERTQDNTQQRSRIKVKRIRSWCQVTRDSIKIDSSYCWKKGAPVYPGSFVVIARQLGLDVYSMNDDGPDLFVGITSRVTLMSSPDLGVIEYHT